MISRVCRSHDSSLVHVLQNKDWLEKYCDRKKPNSDTRKAIPYIWRPKLIVAKKVQQWSVSFPSISFFPTVHTLLCFFRCLVTLGQSSSTCLALWTSCGERGWVRANGRHAHLCTTSGGTNAHCLCKWRVCALPKGPLVGRDPGVGDHVFISVKGHSS